MKRILFKFAVYAVTGTLLFFGIQNFKSTAQGLLTAIVEDTKTPVQQRISTDKSSYKLNENVLIKGDGFAAYEPVEISINLVEPAAITDSPVSQWMVFTDENGSFSTDWVLGMPGTRFRLSAAGVFSKAETDAIYIVEVQTASLEQCGNGTLDVPLQCADPNWINGNLNGNQAHYMENESVPYRLLFDGLEAGIEHTLTIEWDTTQDGHHALDYLTTYNRTETDANPCTGVPGCDPASFATVDIPLDATVVNGPDGTAGTADDIDQAHGHFTLFGGVLNGVSDYVLAGSLLGNSQTSITITFTPSVSNPVIAWGGHIASRADWGAGNSAIQISGAPFHMRVLAVDGSGGNQDRSLQSDAVYYPGDIVIIKDAQPNSTQTFSFTALGPQVANFTLDDDGVNTNTYSNTQGFANLTNFGAGHTVTITEGGSSPYVLVGLVCTSDPRGGDGVDNNVVSLDNRQAVITLEEGELVTCTYTNARPTAAALSISGWVEATEGRMIPNATVTVTRLATGDTYYTRTGSFGGFNFNGMGAGEEYLIRVRAKGYTFAPDSVVVFLSEDLIGLTFTAQPGP